MRIFGACCTVMLVMSVLAGVAPAQVTCPDATDTSTVLTSDCLVDTGLRAAIEAALGKSSGANITVGELQGLTILDARERQISDATGIEYATGLTLIALSKNNLSSIDLTSNTALERIGVGKNALTSIDVTGLDKVEILYLDDNELTEITGLDDLTKLGYLKADGNDFESIDLTNNTALYYISLDDNELGPYDDDDDDMTDDVFPIIGLSNLTGLTELSLTDNELTSIDASNSTRLIRLLLNRNSLTSVDVSDLSKLLALGLDGNDLASIDVSDLTSLRGLYLDDNELGPYDHDDDEMTDDVSPITGLSNLGALVRLWVGNNQLTSLDLTGLVKLKWLRVCGNSELLRSNIIQEPSTPTLYPSLGRCSGGL